MPPKQPLTTTVSSRGASEGPYTNCPSLSVLIEMSQGTGYVRSLPPSPVASTCKVAGRCRWISFSGRTTSLRGRKSFGMAGWSFCVLDHTTAPCFDSASTTMFSRGVSNVWASAHSSSVLTNAATFESPCHCTALIQWSKGNLDGICPLQRESR